MDILTSLLAMTLTGRVSRREMDRGRVLISRSMDRKGLEFDPCLFQEEGQGPKGSNLLLELIFDNLVLA